MKTVSGKIDALQAMRAFAAAFVMLYHGTQIIHGALGHLFLDNIFCAGFSGVDIFFVLSGFVIYYTAVGRNYTTGYFLEKRFIRIYPIYWVVVILILLLYLASPSPAESHKGNLLVILKSFILFPQEKPVLGISWTLTYEIIFYIVFAWTFLKKPVYLLRVFACWLAFIFLAQITGIRSGNPALDIFINPITINFALGCVVAYYYIKYPHFKYYRLFIITGLLYFMVSWLLQYHYQPKTIINGNGFPEDYSRVLMYGIPAAIFMFGILHARIPVSKLLVHLGDASYSLYLLHVNIISALLKIILKLHLQHYFSGFAGALVIFAATLALASCFYLLVEKPLLKMLGRVMLKRANKTALATKTV